MWVLGVLDLMFRVWGSWISGFWIWGSRVWDLGFRVQGFWIFGFGALDLGFRVWASHKAQATYQLVWRC